MEEWASALGLEEADRLRWAAAGHLHDAMKDAPVDTLRGLAGPDWPEALLHAPACAARLREAGVRDEELMLAIECHSTGHPDFDLLGEYLYMADYLEPGRKFEPARRAELRNRLPGERNAVLLQVLRDRIQNRLELGSTLRLDSIRLWNRVAGA
jgi:HD superfamily phosphohydrolase YqeK